MKIRNEKKRYSWLTGWNAYFVGLSYEDTRKTALILPSLDEAVALRGWEMAAAVDFENDGSRGSFRRFCPYI